MLVSFEETGKMISAGRLLHIAGNESLLKKLPKGNWIGGSTEYFMTADGGTVTDDMLFVTSFPYDEYKIDTYDAGTISNVTIDAFENGFSIVILPFDSAVHKTYAEKAPEFEGMFMKNITGWVSGFNLEVEGQTPVAVNGQTGEAFSDKAVVVHIRVPDDKLVSIGMVNIFTQDEQSPVITFTEDGFSVRTCLVDGKEVVLSEYLAENKIDTQIPLVGSYSGVGVNISIKSIEDDGLIQLYAPVFSGIEYRIAEPVKNYVEEFASHLESVKDIEAVFSCNCILNFLYGELEGKDIEAFFGPITFGEIAYQLVNQTLVYVTVS